MSTATESKHTPGPWRSHVTLAARTVHADDGSQIAFASFRNPNSGEDEANVRLIAAAPAMLEALEEFVRVMEMPATTVAMPHTVKMAKAAIRLAKGGTL